MRLIYMFLLLLLFQINGIGQISEHEKRMIYLNSIDLIYDKYGKYCTYMGGDDSYKFQGLFTNDNSEVANDILPANDLGSTLRVSEYHDLLIRYYKEFRLQAEIDVLELSEIKETNGLLTLEARCRKIITGITRNNLGGINYSDTVFLTFDLVVWKKQDFTLRIERITNNNPAGKYLVVFPTIKRLFGKAKVLEPGTVLEVEGYSDSEIVLNDEPYILLRDIDRRDVISFKMRNSHNPDRQLVSYRKEQYSDDKNGRQLEFRSHPFTLAVLGSIVGGRSSEILTEDERFNADPTVNQENSLSYSYGLRIGLDLIKTKHFGLVLNTGVDQYSIRANISLENFKYSFNAVDPDSYNYERRVQISSLQESVEMSFLNIPIGLASYIHIASNRFYFGGDISTTVQTSSAFRSVASVSYSGYYEDLFEVEFDDPSIYDFGDHDFDTKPNYTEPSDLVAFNLYLGYERIFSRRSSIFIQYNSYRSMSDLFSKTENPITTDRSAINSLTLRNDYGLEFNSFTLGYKFRL